MHFILKIQKSLYPAFNRFLVGQTLSHFLFTRISNIMSFYIRLPFTLVVGYNHRGQNRQVIIKTKLALHSTYSMFSNSTSWKDEYKTGRWHWQKAKKHLKLQLKCYCFSSCTADDLGNLTTFGVYRRARLIKDGVERQFFVCQCKGNYWIRAQVAQL